MLKSRTEDIFLKLLKCDGIKQKDRVRYLTRSRFYDELARSQILPRVRPLQSWPLKSFFVLGSSPET